MRSASSWSKICCPRCALRCKSFSRPAWPTGRKSLADAIANAKKLKIDPDSLDVVQQLKVELAEGGDLDRTEDKV
jgi:hypothetical protein